NLEYEYSLLVAYFALLLIPASAFFYPPHLLPIKDDKYSPRVGFALFWIFIVGPFVAAIPGLVDFGAGICSGSFTGFVSGMAVQALPAWVLAHAAYRGIRRARIEGKRKRAILAAWLGAYAPIMLVLGLTLWFSPQTRTVNIRAGFLHGPI